MYNSPLHTFHIPVMGLAYTIDSPVKVARFGIASAISIVEDRLIEMMRRHYYPSIQKEYVPISTHEPDYRARRITDYLNLVNTIVQQQVEKLKGSAFEAGSEIVKYFEMLPETNRLKVRYKQMVQATSCAEKEKLQARLRAGIRAGSIDVNILTKTDRDQVDSEGQIIPDGSDAVAALRGYAKSELTNSSLILSAGMNPRLYNYLATFSEFDVNGDNGFTKKIIVKVSDYRSALIQGKFLAKKGVWVSEFRIESGLNCGGHAFATDGYLLGPILEEFKRNRQVLIDTLFDLYNAALMKKNNKRFRYPPKLTISVQGGIGTAQEDEFLRRHYLVESTGWGTPFLLVPEATTVDDATLALLSKASEEDLVLSHNSPLGVRFHYLKGTSSHQEKLHRIELDRPGSPCTEKHLAFNTEFTEEPICTASRKYQKLKLAQLQLQKLPPPEFDKKVSEVLDKECLCIGLSNAAAIHYKQPFVKNLHAVTICPGPNIVNFNQLVGLQTMVDHIYGRIDILANQDRPHMFIAELKLYRDFLKVEWQNFMDNQSADNRKKYFNTFFRNMREGIAYYRGLADVAGSGRKAFLKALEEVEGELEVLENGMA